MKKKLVLGLAIGCGLLLTAFDKKEVKNTEQTFQYSISLDIANLEGPVILLDRTTFEPIQTIYPKSPEFKIEGELPIEKMHAWFVLHFPSKYHNPYFYPTSTSCSINFYMDKNTSIKGHYDSLRISNVSNEHMDKVKDFKLNNLPALVRFEAFNEQYFRNSDEEGGSEAEQIAQANKGNALIDEMKNELIEQTGQFTNSEEMAFFLPAMGGQIGVHKLDSLAALCNESVKQTATYKRVVSVSDYMKKQQVPQALKVGDKAPEFTLKDAEGNAYSLSDFKGKHLVIDFWASWCGPCKKEMPFMKELYEKYHSNGLEMLAISTDEDRDAWIKAKDKLNMPYLQLHDINGEASASYFVRGIPYVLLIDPKGTILAIERGEALEKLIKEQLKI